MVQLTFGWKHQCHLMVVIYCYNTVRLIMKLRCCIHIIKKKVLLQQVKPELLLTKIIFFLFADYLVLFVLWTNQVQNKH